MKSLNLGSISGVEIIVLPVALIVSLVLWAVLSVIAFAALGMAPGLALLVGLVVMLLHWSSELVHHIGHANAARRTGYPMQSIKLGGIYGSLALSVYPSDEPELADAIHMRRALGGPIASFLPMVVFGALALFLRGPLWWAAIFLFAENFIFTFQVFLPMGKLLDNDGNMLYRWLRGRGKAEVSVTPGE